MKKYRFPYIDIVFVAVFCLGVFSYILANFATDINTHIEQIRRINANLVSYPANFLFYFIVNLLSGFSNVKIIYVVTAIVLSAAATLKYIISKQYLIYFNPALQSQIKLQSGRYFAIVVLALFFCFAIPDPFSVFVLKKMYLTRFVPMVWHNSTTIFLFPFAILLFWKQLQIFDTSRKLMPLDIVAINLLVIVNLLIKPSFLFAYAPVTFFIVMKGIRTENAKTLLWKLSPVLTTAIIVSIQYYLIYMKQDGSFYNEPSKVLLSAPFELLSNFVPIWYIPIAILCSFALPIFTALIYKEFIWFAPFRFSLALTLVAILISALLIESGPRMTHGNFLWQNVICTYLLFLSTIAYIIPKLINAGKKSLKDKVMLGLFITHALSGILYLLKFILTTSYY